MNRKLIAEIGSNHNGDLELARELIKSARDSGADVAKFQIFNPDSVFSGYQYKQNYFLGDDYRSRSDHTLRSIVEKYSLSLQQYESLYAFTLGLGIDFLATPFTKEEVDFLKELGCRSVKIASMDCDNSQLLSHVVSKRFDMTYLSTGMATAEEIDSAVKMFSSAGLALTLFHCVSLYPTPSNLLNLSRISTLRRRYPGVEVGFSDHSMGTTACVAASVLGCRTFEKHFTLDNTMEGWDHKISADPKVFKKLSEDIDFAISALGSSELVRVESDERVREFRRGAFATRTLAVGETIGEDDIVYRRPAIGISPFRPADCIGRTVVSEVHAGEPILPENLA
jgi:sialic acid synthase SpsE